MADQEQQDDAKFWTKWGVAPQAQADAASEPNSGEAISAEAKPAEDDAKFWAKWGVDPKNLDSPDLTDQQRDVITRWGLDPRNFTHQTAPIERQGSAGGWGLYDPETGERVIGAAERPNEKPGWNSWLSAANGIVQGLGPKIMAEVQALKPGAPADAYDQAKA